MFSKDKVFKLCSDAVCPSMIATLNTSKLFPGIQEGEVLLGKNNKNGNDIRYIEESIIRIINNHNEYLRFLPCAYPYYLSVFTVLGSFILFSIFIIFYLSLKNS